MRRSPIWVAAIAVLLAACPASPPEGVFQCRSDDECPPGMRCAGDGYCRANVQVGPDAGQDARTFDGSVDAQLDAAPDTGIDAYVPRDTGLDARMPDAGRDAGVDAWRMPDAGPPPPLFCPRLPMPPTPVSCPPVGSRPVVDLTPGGMSRDQTGDLSLSCANTYTLSAQLYMMSGTLTIGPGTVILGSLGAALVITPDARIQAVGHPDAPIVFTSNAPAGMRRAGDWGGIIMLGRAPVNTDAASSSIQGLPFDRTQYGGTNAGHDCGALRWVRVEYAGSIFSMNELNGVTLAGCGTGTLLEMVQVHRVQDDGIEIRGERPTCAS